MNFEKPSVVLCEDDKSALDLYNILISIYPQDNISYFPCLLYTSPSPRDMRRSRMPSSA